MTCCKPKSRLEHEMHVMLSACCYATLIVHDGAHLPGAREMGRAARVRRREVCSLHSERDAGVSTCGRAQEGK